jgi:outer membrane protein insertion porin family
MKFLRSCAFILLFAALPSVAEVTYTAGKIVFNHPGPYTQDQLEAAAGIHRGTSFNAKDLGNAAQRLVDTGFFSDVGATLAGRVDSATVLFDIKPIDRSQMVHVDFDNFVWLTHAEIESALQAKAPLFLDYLSETSPLLDEFTATLTSALAAKGITAKVTHDTIEPTLVSPERTLQFHIATPAVRVANVKLAGVSPDLVPLIQKSLNAAARAPYSESPAGATTADRILAPLLDAGYVQASLSGITLEPALSGDTASVVLSATLAPGDIYHVSGITFAGTPLLSAESFAASAKLHSSDIASRKLLYDTLAPLDAAYRRQGYMDIIIVAEPDANPATRQVAYTVTVKPGEQYHVNEVTARNLDPAAQDDFDRGFLMKKGDLFNPDYIHTFFVNNPGLKTLTPYGGSYKAYADPNTHTVDVVLTFARGATPSITEDVVVPAL